MEQCLNGTKGNLRKLFIHYIFLQGVIELVLAPCCCGLSTDFYMFSELLVSTLHFFSWFLWNNFWPHLCLATKFESYLFMKCFLSFLLAPPIFHWLGHNCGTPPPGTLPPTPVIRILYLLRWQALPACSNWYLFLSLSWFFFWQEDLLTCTLGRIRALIGLSSHSLWLAFLICIDHSHFHSWKGFFSPCISKYFSLNFFKNLPDSDISL